MEKYLGHIITFLISVVLAGVIGYFTGQIESIRQINEVEARLVEKIEAVKGMSRDKIGTLRIVDAKVSKDIEHMSKGIEHIKIQVEEIRDHTARLPVIQGDLDRIGNIINRLEADAPHRVREDENNRIWRKNIDEWRGNTNERLKVIEASAN